MNKRRSVICNRSTVYLGQPFATLPSTNMTRFNQHTTTLSKALLTAGLLGGAALSTLGAGSAQAMQSRNDCAFGDTSMSGFVKCRDVNWTTGWTKGDKTLTNLTFLPTIAENEDPSGVFSFIWDDFTNNDVSPDDMWTVLAEFNPALPPPNTGSYSYDLAITDPGWTFKDVELDVDHAGTGQDVTKVVKNAVGTTIATLNSINGMPDGPDPISGTFISVTDTWDLDPNTGTIMSISNSYTQTPAPLPILGAAAALGSLRKLRKFSSRLKTFSMR